MTHAQTVTLSHLPYGSTHCSPMQCPHTGSGQPRYQIICAIRYSHICTPSRRMSWAYSFLRGRRGSLKESEEKGKNADLYQLSYFTSMLKQVYDLRGFGVLG